MGANQNSSRNLAYILNSTRRPSLLTPSRLHSYEQLLALEIELGTAVETRNDASKNTFETGDRNRTKNQFISS
jgi:hypothetical protein